MDLFNLIGEDEMNSRKITAEYRLAHWTQTIQDRVTSGTSITEFCQSRGICRNTYFYWQRKVREAAYLELVPVTKADAVIPSGWAVCAPGKAESAESKVYIEIGKCRVAVGNEFNTTMLEKVCRVLVELC